MALKARLIQNSFTAGEISPRLLGRTDLEKYFSGCERLENFVLQQLGGVRRRPGTTFVAEVKDSNTPPVLLPFQFNVVQAYILEAGAGYFRFFKDEAAISVDLTATTIANGTFDTSLASWTTRNAGIGNVTHDAVGKQASFSGGGAGNEARLYQQITVAAGDQAKVHAVQFLMRSGSLIVRVGTTLGGQEVFANRTVNAGHHVISFTPTAGTIFLEFEASGSATLDDVRALSNTPLELATPYAAADLTGLRTEQSADVMWIVHKNYLPRRLKRFSHIDWSLEEYRPAGNPFGLFTGKNFPNSVALWKSRLWFAGFAEDPLTVHSTKIDNFEDMTTGANAADAIKFVLTGKQVNLPQWMTGVKDLIIGTFGNESQIRGGQDGTVTPSNINHSPHTTHGSAFVPPVVISNVIVFVQRAKKKVRQLVFNFDTDTLVAPDLTILSDHLFDTTTITKIAYQQEPDSIIWLIRSDGQLVSLTFGKDQNVIGWGRHVTDGAFEDVAVISHSSGGKDAVWVIVRRTINGVTKRYIEFLDDISGFYGQRLTDSSLRTIFASPQTAVSGLAHLEGKTVDIIGDGAVFPQKAVTGGSVTLDAPGAKDIEVGLPYTSTLVPVRPELSQETIQGVPVSRIANKVRVSNTLGIKINNQQVSWRSAADLMDKPPALFSGEVDVVTLGWGPEEGKVTVTQALPLPATVLSLVSELSIGDQG